MMPGYRAPDMPGSKSRDENFSWVFAENPLKDLVGTTKRVVNAQITRLWTNNKMMSLYVNEDLCRPVTAGATLGVPGVGTRGSMPYQSNNKIKINTDTLAGKLVQSNSRVQAASIAGNWKTFKLARKLDRILDAEFNRGKLFLEVSKVLIDALVTGSGYLYIGDDDNKVTYERWYYNELFVDPFDAAYGAPTMLFRMRYIKRENALALWGKDPELADLIRKSPSASAPPFAWTPYQSGMVALFEAWALPVGKRKGRHVICLENCVLRDEAWKDDCFPVVMFKASEFPLGWYGQGLAVQAAGAQIQLNETLNVQAQSARLGIAPYWTVAGGAEISIKQMNNVPGHIVTSNGPEPKWNANPPFHPATNDFTARLEQQIDAMYGISAIESQGSFQSRNDSNPALVTLQDAWMARHTILLKNWSDHFFMYVAERTIDTAKDIASRKGSYPVIAQKGDRAWAMDWKDFMELEKENYRLSLTSAGPPLTEQAKRKMALEMRDNMLISPEKALQMMMGPADIESVTDSVAAYENNAEWLVEELMEGRLPECSSMQRPELVQDRVRRAGLTAQEHGAPPEVLQNFETFLATVASDLSQQQAATMQMMAQGQANGSSSPGLPGLAPATGLSPAA